MTAHTAEPSRETDRTPVIIGVAQWTQRDIDPLEALDPLSLLETVSRRAVEDAGAGPGLLGRIDRIAVPGIVSWPLRNPARLLAERLGCRPRVEIVSTVGGNMQQQLLNDAALSILREDCEVALLAGAEAQHTVWRAQRGGIELDWPTSDQPERCVAGDARPSSSDVEIAHGLNLPLFVYPLFENAFRARRGWSLAEHTARLGELCSRLTETAEENPYAWFPKRRKPEEITRVTAENRMIAFPYTKFMNATPDVDQGAALLMTSLSKARALGVPEDRLVYWWGGGGAVEEPWFLSERPRLDGSPALARSAHAAISSAGIGVDGIDFFDLYSCFPCAIEIACDELGIEAGDPRPLTVTGGLPYAGGPWNNYCTQAIAAMVEKLRAAPGAKGLVTGLGWWLSRHSAGVYASAPPPPTRNAQTKIAASPPREAEAPLAVAVDPQGGGEIETYTVLYERDGTPRIGIVVGRLDDGRRFLAQTPADARLLEELVRDEAIGRRGRVAAGTGLNRFHPE